MTGSFTPPQVDWWAAAPVLAVMLAAVVGVLVEAFAPRSSRRIVQLIVALGGLAISLLFLILLWGSEANSAVLLDVTSGLTMGMIVDQVTVYLQIALVVMGALSVLLLADRGGSALDAFAAAPATRPDSPGERAAERAGRQVTDVFPLTMFAIGGMMIFTAAADLLTMFVALEVFSLPLYLMCGLARHQRLRSQEASLKYFLLGAFASAGFLFGMALMYGAAGTLNLTLLARQVGQVMLTAQQEGTEVSYPPLVIIAALLMLAALLFKVGAVPFHSWTPDVYDGAPTPVTAFMSACTKAAAFGAILRLVLPPTPIEEGLAWPGVMWFFSGAMQNALIVVAAATMIVGSVVAIRQNDIKRMLAYSSVAHAGFILVGVISYQVTEIRAVLYYLFVYGLASIAAFGIISLVRVRNADGSVGQEAKNLDQWDGLGRRSPVLAACFAVLMLAFAGFPLTSGFIAKFGVFAAAITSGQTPMIVLAVIGVLMSLVAASFYLRVIVRMYFADVDQDAPAPTVVIRGWFTGVAIGVGVIATVLFGVLPGLLLGPAGSVLALR